MADPAISVVVPAYNAEGPLRDLLSALGRQSLPPEAFEVVVVDDCSTDGTPEVARAAGVRVLAPEKRGGSFAARNLALAATRASIVAFTDADCVPADDWLEQGLSEFDRLQADILGGRIEPQPPTRLGTTGILDLARCLDQERCVGEAGFAATANVLIARRVFDAIGPFDGPLVAGDVEFSVRARGAGFRLVYSDRPMVAHPLRAKTSQVLKKSFRTGFGAGQWELLATGPLRAHRAPWRSWASFRPERDVLRGSRAAKYRTSSRRMWQMDVAYYFLFQLPHLAGSFAASLTRGRGLRA
jgi:glycosyltransferase involved in cell wall biosynthesis